MHMATEELEVVQTAEASPAPGGARRDLLWGAGLLGAFLLISAGFMFGYSPRFRRALIGWGDFRLTVVHSNDTMGYLDVCGG